MNCCRVSEMRNKEVINSENGCRIGCVDDVEIDTVTAKLTAIIIYGRQRLFGLLGRQEDIIIKWDHIELVGEDTILVNHCPVHHNNRRNKYFPFFK